MNPVSLVVDDHSLTLEDVGEGPSVVLLHGLAGSRQIWDETRVGLVDAGYRVISYDQRGHGDSSDTHGPWTIADLASDLSRVLDHLQVGQACVIGHSMGGRAMFKFALEAPSRISAVVAVGANSEAPSGTYHDILYGCRIATVADGLTGFRRAFEAAGEIPERIQWDEAYARSFEAAFVRNRPAMLVQALEAILTMPALTARLSSLKVPMLTVVGERDVHVRRLADEYRALVADCQTLVIEDCHHYPMVDAEPAFRRGLIDFLDRRVRMNASVGEAP